MEELWHVIKVLVVFSICVAFCLNPYEKNYSYEKTNYINKIYHYATFMQLTLYLNIKVSSEAILLEGKCYTNVTLSQ